MYKLQILLPLLRNFYYTPPENSIKFLHDCVHRDDYITRNDHVIFMFKVAMHLYTVNKVKFFIKKKKKGLDFGRVCEKRPTYWGTQTQQKGK